MNQSTRYVMDIYQVMVVIRDTLEYLVPRGNEYSVDVYKQRQSIIKNCLDENHPFSKFLAQNGETGEKIKTNIKDFYDMCYGEEAHAVFLENDKVITDDGYTNQVIDYVVGLHETLFDVCRGFDNHAKEAKTEEKEFEELLTKENEYYRCVAGLVITDKIHKLFLEFNKAMRENKGQPSPQSNFISNDLKKAIGFFKFTEEHSNYTDPIYQLAVSKTRDVVDLMGGKVPTENGAEPKTLTPEERGTLLRNKIQELHGLWIKTIALTESDWRAAYTQEIKAVIDFDKARREAAENKVDEAKVTEETATDKKESTDEVKKA